MLSFGVMVCSTSLAIVLTLRVSRPIGQLVAGVQAYARGSYNAPLRVDAHDEFGDRKFDKEAMMVDLGEPARDPIPGFSKALVGVPIDAKGHEVTFVLPTKEENEHIAR